MMAQQPETAILRQVREYLQWNGWLVIRNQQGLGSHKGLSDQTAIKDGRVIWVEIKTPIGRLSEVQEKFRADVEAYGGEYLVARRVEDVEHLGRGSK